MSNLIYKNKQYLNEDALENIVAYALRTDKDDLNNPIQRIAWGGQGIITRTPQSAIDGFNAVKKIYQKTDGNLLHHIIITFRTRHNHKPVTNYEIIQIMSNVGFQLLKDGFQNMYFVHNEQDSIHAHLVINSINFMTGKRIADKNHLTHGIISDLYQMTPNLQWDLRVLYKRNDIKNDYYI